MDHTKLLFVICSLLMYKFASCKGNEATPSVEEQKNQFETQQTSSRRAYYEYLNEWNQLKNILRQCFCFAKKPNDVSVTDKINQNGENLERLVVYLYKDTSSNEVKMYLPNDEKQLLIPDLAFDRGDVLDTVLSDAIENLFNKHSDLLTNRKQFSRPDISTLINFESASQKLPTLKTMGGEKPVNQDHNPVQIGDSLQQPNLFLKIQPIEYVPYKDKTEEVIEIENDITHKINLASPQDSQNIIETSTSNLNQDLISPEDVNKIDMDTNEEQPVEITHEKADNQFIESNKDEDKTVIEVEQKPTINLNLNTLEIQPQNTNNSDQNQQININIGKVPKSETESITLEPNKLVKGSNSSINLTHENLKPVTLKDNTDSPGNVQIVPESYSPIKLTESPSTLTSYTPQYIVIDKLQPKEIEGVTTEPNLLLNIVSTERPAVHPALHYSLGNARKKLMKENQKSKVKTNINFDNWFKQQLELVQFADSKASNSIDIATLKYLVAMTLQKGGYYLTEQGILVDADGVELDTANLILRPILIGDSVQYKKVIKGKVGSFKLPSDTPYLEAILLSSVSPQKTLGIIPLGKMFLPRNYQTPSKLNGGSGNDCNKCNRNTLLLSSQQSPRNAFLSGPYTNPLISNNFALSKIKPVAIEDNAYINQVVLKPFKATRLTGPYVKEDYRILPVPQIQSLIHEIYKPVVDGAFSLGDTVTREPVSKYPFGMLIPGFRIIGGNAATSSGTPVSSKGRSGLDPKNFTNNK